MGCGCCSTPRKPDAFWKDQPIFEEDRERVDFLDLLFYVFNIDNGYEFRNVAAELKYLNWVVEKNNHHLFPEADRFGRYNLEELLDFMVRYEVNYLFSTKISKWIEFFHMFREGGPKVLVLMKRKMQAKDSYTYTLTVSYNEFNNRPEHTYSFNHIYSSYGWVAVSEMIHEYKQQMEHKEYDRKIAEARAKLEDS
jgi:hypothetical protein